MCLYAHALYSFALCVSFSKEGASYVCKEITLQNTRWECKRTATERAMTSAWNSIAMRRTQMHSAHRSHLKGGTPGLGANGATVWSIYIYIYEYISCVSAAYVNLYLLVNTHTRHTPIYLIRHSAYLHKLGPSFRLPAANPPLLTTNF